MAIYQYPLANTSRSDMSKYAASILISLIFIHYINTQAFSDFNMDSNESIGYRIEITTKSINYAIINELETTLEHNGYTHTFREKSTGKICNQEYQGEVISLLSNLTHGTKNYKINVYLSYYVNCNTNTVFNLLLRIENFICGGSIPALSNEINFVGNLVFGMLAGKLGEDRVTLKRFSTMVEE